MRSALITLALLILLHQRVPAQTAAPVFLLQGRVVDSVSGAGIEGLELLLPSQKRVVFTGTDGGFAFDQMHPGIFAICIRRGTATSDTLRFFADPAHAQLPDIRIQSTSQPAEPVDASMPEVTVSTDDADDGGPAPTDYAAATQAGRNPFSDATSFNLFAFRFQPRSYNRRTQEVSINGVPMHDIASLNTAWISWSGLNDAFRNRDQHYGAGASDAAFGGIAGSLGFDITAAAQRPQTRLSYALTNRSYRNRINFSKSSGILPSGWGWSLTASYRVAREGFVPGTFYEGASLYAGLSKILSPASSLHLSFCGAWSRAGRGAAVTEETVQLSDDPGYNPNWGLQNGRLRNARVSSGLQPLLLLTHQYRPGRRFRMESSLMAQAGQSGTTGLDYYNASNPRPDYYRYLPSYLSTTGRDPQLAAFYTKPQIEWDELYQQNRLQWDSVSNVEGIAGNSVGGHRSVYGLYRDVQDLRKAVGGTNFQWKPLIALQVNGGAAFIVQNEARYREMADLLGGDFYLNTNAFLNTGADPQLAQYDIRVPDRIIRVGDRYGYDYIARSQEAAVWTGLRASFRRVDAHVEARMLHRAYQRDGRFQSGLFPQSSYGSSPWASKTGATVKAGLAYRVTGRTQLVANAAMGQTPPAFDVVFIAPRVRNTLNTKAELEAMQTLELGLSHRSGLVHLHLMGFAMRTSSGTELRRYYSDDPAFASFVNYLMVGVAKQYTGAELGAELQLSPLISLRTGVSLTDAFYAANPDGVYIYGDNDTTELPVRKDVYLKNLALASGPQTAATLGLTYRSTRYWYAGITANYAARNFVDVNPDRRSELAVRGLETSGAAYHDILAQEQLPAAWTLDISAGKNWLLSRYSKRLPKNTYLYLNAALSNLLNSRFRTGGYEQLRFDYAGQNPDKFASKYFYAPGRNFLINLSVRW